MRDERIHVDQREQIALSIAYQLLYDMGDMEPTDAKSNRGSRLRHHLEWRDERKTQLPAKVNSIEELHSAMALEGPPQAFSINMI